MSGFKERHYDYLRDPEAIYARSFDTIRTEADLSRFTADEADVVTRIIHACGMVDIAADIGFTPGAVAAGMEALRAGRAIFCDVQMVARGIIPRLLPNGVDIVCTLDDAGVAERAGALRTTRSAAAVDIWAERIDGAILVFGNAPTALFRLLECVSQADARPALVVGMPVGFVGAVESKLALAEHPELASIIVHGRRGGSAMAAATVNAIAILSRAAS
ncbi:hypothetical protein LA66_12665 [Aureimonas altamirensis]|uniref:Cobalamin biosynthesis precorrin-8X methylmutase CobH/CbiC domain-containing protein n=1 Tax=Aureimonas altamirensis TaxID=370622 RepID=A0A0B1Q5V8_9HYPH|nr:precorrin-8X methylmutase [Aureimonas altamirensis]KHJ54307.1 hypothetical protein LA66_12665 [Aureimonas altamirensis]